MPKRTAPQAYSEHAVACKKLMGMIFEYLDDTDAREANWNHVGTAAQFREQLEHLCVSVASHAGEAEEVVLKRITDAMTDLPMPFIAS